MKKNNLIFSLFFIVTLISSCGKKTVDVVINETPILDGYFMRDVNAQPNGTVGTPNVYLGDAANYMTSNYFLFAYPNPTISNFNLDLKAINSSSLKKIWITPAKWNTTFTDNFTPFKNKNALVIGSNTHVFEKTDSINNLKINTENFQEGYYRLYVQMDGKTFYDNIAIYKN